MADIISNILSVSVAGIGKLPLAEKGNTFTANGTKRDYKSGRQAQDGGYIETPVPAKLELTLNCKTIDINAVNGINAHDITVRMADGSVWMLAQAFLAEPVSVGDGEAKAVLMSNLSERIS